MTNKIKIGILGYGNLAKGIERNISNFPDLELLAIFTRRDPLQFSNPLILSSEKLMDFQDKIDLLILCGGSNDDLPQQGPELSKYFNTLDSYDNHKLIPHYFEEVNKSALENNKTCLISIGWDPGLFSLNRLIFQSILPKGESYTFWGKGVSQGHSQALRKVPGVKYGVQYTIPIEESIRLVKEGKNPVFQTHEKHKRVCYAVLEEGFDGEEVSETIKNIPNYFKEYQTEVHFISKEDFLKNHSQMPHGGVVLRSGLTGENIQNMEFKLQLENNPDFTSSVLLAYARALYRLSKEKTGAFTIFDIPLAYLSDLDSFDLRKSLL